MTTVSKKDFYTETEEREVLMCNNCMRSMDELPEEERIIEAFDEIHLCSRCVVDLHSECQEIDEVEAEKICMEDGSLGDVIEIEAKTVKRPIVASPDLDMSIMDLKIGTVLALIAPVSIIIAFSILIDETQDESSRESAWMVIVHLTGVAIWATGIFVGYSML